MDKVQIAGLVLGSAAVGALISALMTAAIQWRERVARRRELIFSKSVEMAQKTTELLFKVALEKGSGSLYPEIVTARWYHRQLSSLFDSGRIAPDLEEEFAEYINGSHSELHKRL